jgi:hypothetical protein
MIILSPSAAPPFKIVRSADADAAGARAKLGPVVSESEWVMATARLRGARSAVLV